MEVNMKRAGIAVIIFNIVLLLMLLAAAEVTFLQFKDSIFRFCDRTELRLGMSQYKGNMFFSVKDAYILCNKLKDETVAYSGEISGMVQAGRKSDKILITASNEHIHEFFPIEIIEGRFLSKWHCSNGSKVAVISKNLAARLFMSTDVVGNEIVINRIKYRIIGVYEEKITHLTFFSLEDSERIYIPFTSIEGYQQIPAGSIYISNRMGKGYTIDNLTKAMGQKYLAQLMSYNIKDYSGAAMYIEQFKRIVLFFIGLSIILLLFKVIRCIVRELTLFIKGCLAENYLIDVVKEKKIKILLYLLEIILLVFGIAAVYLLVRFNFRLPDNLVPEDNIFDIKFYYDSLEDSIRTGNSKEFPITVFNICFRTCLIYAAGISVLILFQWSRTYRSILRILKRESKFL